MKILITETQSVVAQYLAQYLSYKHQVYCLSDYVLEVKGVDQVYSWNSLSQGQLPKIDIIIHLVNNSSEAELDLTEKIYSYFRFSTASKFILLSSIQAAVPQSGSAPDLITEEVICKPDTTFGRSLLELENYLLSNPSPKDKSVIILRAASIYGPGITSDLYKLYSYLQKGFFWPFNSFGNQRTYTSIGNLEYVIGAIIENDIASGVYNVVDDDAISTNDLVQIIQATIGQQQRIYNNLPSTLINIISLLYHFLGLPFGKKNNDFFINKCVVSNLKIRKALSIRYMPYSLQEDFIDTLHSYRNMEKIN